MAFLEYDLENKQTDLESENWKQWTDTQYTNSQTTKGVYDRVNRQGKFDSTMVWCKTILGFAFVSMENYVKHIGCNMPWIETKKK